MPALSFVKTNSLVLFLALALVSLWSSWGEPVLSSHSFRQAQSAQTAAIFLEEGWDPLHTKFRYNGKPGISVLEFPIYQSLEAGLTRATGLDIVQSGRLLAWFFGLIFALAVSAVSLILDRRLTRDGSQLWLKAALIFSIPLLFGLSQWVTIETLNASCATLSLLIFIIIFQPERIISRCYYLLSLFFIFTALSLVIKPTFLFSYAPLFLGVLWHEYEKIENRMVFLPKFIAIISLGVCAFFLASLWFIHGDKVNRAANAYGAIGSTASFYFSLTALGNARGWLVLLQRVFLYVLGPGTILVLLGALNFFRTGMAESWRSNRFCIIGAMSGFLIYILSFSNLNMRHNYYQLPGVFLVGLSLILLLPKSLFEGTGKIFLVALVIANAVWGQLRLAKQDQDWKRAISFLQTRYARGGDLPELKVVFNHDESLPVLALYLDRYVKGMRSETSVTEWAGADLIACDNSLDLLCQKQALSQCNGSAQSFGRLWICPELAH